MTTSSTRLYRRPFGYAYAFASHHFTYLYTHIFILLFVKHIKQSVLSSRVRFLYICFNETTFGITLCISQLTLTFYKAPASAPAAFFTPICRANVMDCFLCKCGASQVNALRNMPIAYILQIDSHRKIVSPPRKPSCRLHQVMPRSVIAIFAIHIGAEYDDRTQEKR